MNIRPAGTWVDRHDSASFDGLLDEAIALFFSSMRIVLARKRS